MHDLRCHSKVQRHVGVMTALGSKEASLPNKFKNYLHGAFLECGSWDAVRVQSDAVVSFTTDLGTEASLGTMPAVSIPDLFPHLPEDLSGEMEFDYNPGRCLQQGPMVADPGERFFKQAMTSPGILHIIHNATHDVLTSMKGHASWQDQHKLLTQFLGAKWNRERFVAKCLVTPAAKERAYLFDTFDGEWIEWRFGSLLASIDHLLGLELTLRTYWHVDRFRQDVARGHGDEEAASRSRDGIDAKDVSAPRWPHSLTHRPR